jgi:CheY-like chemotaxis protein
MDKRKVKILIVDDDPSVRNVINAYLEDAGYKIGCASDGNVALQMLAADSYDLVITDLKMPNMDGRALLQIMADRFPSIPKLVLTGYSTDDDIIHALKTGASDFITKPIMDFAILEHSVEKAISMKKLNDERNRYFEQLTQVNDVISMLNRGIETEEIFRILSNSLKKTIPFNWLALAMIDEAAGSVTIKMIESDVDGARQSIKHFLLDDLSLKSVAQKKEVLLITDLRQHWLDNPGSKGSKMLLDVGMYSSIIFPLIINNRTRGFLIFASMKPNAFKEEHSFLLKSLSGQISFSIQRGESFGARDAHPAARTAGEGEDFRGVENAEDHDLRPEPPGGTARF